MILTDEDEIVIHSLPIVKKGKTKRPLNLSLSVELNKQNGYDV